MESILGSHPKAVAALATALAHSLWQCALLALLAAASLKALHRRSAALQHAVGMGFLLAMAVLPAGTFLHGLGQPTGEMSQRVLLAAQDFGVTSPLMAAPSSGWGPVLCAFWLVGVAFMLVRYIGGLWWVGWLERRAFQPLPPRWHAQLNALKRTMGITRAVTVRVADDVLVPFTARLFQPIVWLPLSLLTRLPPAQIKALLAHELAHIHRLDWLWNGVQCFIEALLFFHPGVWWLSRRIREAREHACDDAAAVACADAVALAEALAALASEQQPRPRLLLAANGSPLMSRIRHLLSGSPTPSRSWAPVGFTVLLAMGAVLTASLEIGYAESSLGTAVRSAVSMRDEPHVLLASGAEEPNSKPVAGSIREQMIRDAVQTGQAEAHAARTAAQVERLVEYVVRDAEQAARIEGIAARVAEDASRRAEEAALDQAALMREARPAAVAVRAPPPEVSEQAARDVEQAAGVPTAIAITSC